VGVDDEVVTVAAALGVEGAAAGDQAQSLLGDGPEQAPFGKATFGYRWTPSTVKWRVTPSARRTRTMSPAASSRSP
jgi:hypothetical protein